MHYVDGKTILTKWNAMNIYRGCTHGCIYCDSRSKCYHIAHAFEDIEVKRNAPELLESALKSKRKKLMISTGSMSDPYMPLEKNLQLTRRCLEVIERYGFGATVITKSDLVLRDVDLLERINDKCKSVVQMSLTVADDELCKKIEPHVCTVSRRVEVLMELKKRNIPTVVWLTPVLPFLTDTRSNVESLLQRCVEAGVKGIVCFDMGLTLREGSREHYYQCLDKTFPSLKEQYQRQFGYAQNVVSPHNAELMKLFVETCQAHGILCRPQDCFDYINAIPADASQQSLFDD